jgi:hypothetical protein
MINPDFMAFQVGYFFGLETTNNNWIKCEPWFSDGFHQYLYKSIVEVISGWITIIH